MLRKLSDLASLYMHIPLSARHRLSLPFADQATIQSQWIALRSYNDAIRQARLATVQQVVAVLPRHRNSEGNEAMLFVFGTFTSVYRTIELLSHALAPQYQEFQLLPVLNPVRRSDVASNPEAARMLKRLFTRSGILFQISSNDA